MVAIFLANVRRAISGLMPVAEIQFRKYADPATEQLNNTGTMRWRTNNRFAAPIVVRMPGGYGKDVGDPWHSLSAEVTWAHAVGWQVAIPSNAADAVGLLRSAMRGRNPELWEITDVAERAVPNVDLSFGSPPPRTTA